MEITSHEIVENKKASNVSLRILGRRLFGAVEVLAGSGLTVVGVKLAGISPATFGLSGVAGYMLINAGALLTIKGLAEVSTGRKHSYFPKPVE